MTDPQVLATIVICAAIIYACTRLIARQERCDPPAVPWTCPHCAQRLNLDVTRASVSYIDTTEAHHHLLLHGESE